MEVYFWSGLRVANDSGVPPVIKVTFPPRPENATAVDAVQEANETFYNILALTVGITGMLFDTPNFPSAELDECNQPQVPFCSWPWSSSSGIEIGRQSVRGTDT